MVPSALADDPHGAGPGSLVDATQEVRVRITGMTCAGCASSVQRAIESQPGVRTASVSLAQGMATVTGTGIEPDRLISAVERRGFDAETVEEEPTPAEWRSSIEVRQSENERRWRFRALVGLGVWTPMAILHWTVSGPWVPWVMLAGATAVLAIAGGGFYRSAARAARKGTTNMDTLIAIGATTAYVYSIVTFTQILRGEAAAGQPLYFGEAAALLGIISLGHWMEARASARAGSAVRELLELQPDEARRLDPAGGVRVIPSADVRAGDRILVRPGDRVAVDGIVVDGVTEVDESVVTGESLPVPKRPGDQVVAGALNTTGRLIIQSGVDGRHTTVARIADIVQRAQSSKAKVQRIADRVCSVFVPAVLVISLVTFAAWWIAGDPGRGVVATVTVLIISCPCALGLATPMAVMVGAGAASRRGILVKSAAALEIAGRGRHVVFDKTGTLTTGDAVVTRMRLAGEVERDTAADFDLSVKPEVDPNAETSAVDAVLDVLRAENELLRLAASVEAVSEHPIARAIVQAAWTRSLDLRPVGEFRAMPGRGVRGVVDGKTIEVLRDESASCRVLVDGRLLGTLTVADSPRPDAAPAIERLRSMGVGVSLLSGDRSEAVRAVGEYVGLRDDEIHAEATPEAKHALIGELGPGTIMVGDGINDAPALARADLGIAMASGTNVAIESADIVIPGDRVMLVPETIHIARSTLRTIKQNLFFAFIYNAAAIPAAALGLLGTHGPLIAAIAMGASDITVIGNALRLKRSLRPDPDREASDAFEATPLDPSRESAHEHEEEPTP